MTVVTYAPSPYQVELFDAVAARGEIDLHVIYLLARDSERQWRDRVPQHSFSAVDRESTGATKRDPRALVNSSDLLIVNYYQHRFVAQLLKTLTTADRHWVFWGERPRLHALSAAGKLYRAWKLRLLHRSQAPIWGAGRLAVDAYRHEFGPARTYVNLPYFSNLERFARARSTVCGAERGDRVFLFSGTFSRRKGVDLVAQAFARLVREGFPVRLRLMGTGELDAQLRGILAGCRDRVEFLGFRDWDELPEAYATADVLCVPSRYDGWGMVVPEGLAAGLPVISTTQTGSAVELVEPRVNGWLIPPNDSEAVYWALREAAALDSNGLAQMSQRAHASVASHSLDQGAERFIAAAKAAMSP